MAFISSSAAIVTATMITATRKTACSATVRTTQCESNMETSECQQKQVCEKIFVVGTLPENDDFMGNKY